MIQIRMENTRLGTVNVLGMDRESLHKLIEGAVEISYVYESIGVGSCLLMMAENHDAMVQVVRETDLFGPIGSVVDQRDLHNPVVLPEIRGRRPKKG